MAAPPRYDPESDEWIWPDDEGYPKPYYEQLPGAPAGYQVPEGYQDAPPGPTPTPIPDLVNDFRGIPVPDPQPTLMPIPRPGPRGGGGGGSSAPYFSFGAFTPPSFDIGPFTPPSWDVAPLRVPDLYPEYLAGDPYPAFVGPTAENFQTDPGYYFRAKEMARAVGNRASASGLRRSGAYDKELASYLGGLASQEFGNVFNRQLGTWRENAANYDRNEALRRGVWESGRLRNLDELARETARYQAAFNDEATEFDRALSVYGVNYNREADEFNRAAQAYGLNFGTASGVAGLNLDAELGSGGLALNREQGNFRNLLSLYDLSSRNLPRYVPTTLPPV